MMRTLLLISLIASCKQQLPPGTERGPCYGNKSCNEGLLCLSDLCVRPPPADCTKVGEKLGYLMLGNYAPQDKREAFHKEIAAECNAAHLTKEQGDCILNASDTKALAKCEKPLGMADCDKMMEHVVKTIAPSDPKIARMLDSDRSKLLRECKERGLTKVHEACVLAAMSEPDLRRCNLGR